MKPSDEFRHEPIKGCGWQENYVFHCWDAARNSGWYFHLGHIFDEGLIDVRAIVVIDGQATSATFQAPGSDCLAAPGLDTKVITPLERIKLRYAAQGAQGPSSEGFFGGTPGETPFGFDIEMISEHPVVDWALYTAKARMDPAVAGNHYEQGARWRGRLWGGGREIEAEGLLVRDHSWGPRAWRKKWWGVWLPMVFDGGRRFISGTAWADDNEWKTFTVLTDQKGIVNVSYDSWVKVVGPFVPRQFDRASVLRNGDGFSERYDYEGHIHLAFTRHSSFLDAQGRPVRRGLADMYSTIRGEGHVGFGTLQHTTAAALVQEGFDNPMDRWAAH